MSHLSQVSALHGKQERQEKERCIMKQSNRFYLSPILNAFLFFLIILIGGVCVGGAWAGTWGLSTATLAWAPNTETDLAGYKLYYGSVSGTFNGTGLAQGNSPITLSLAKLGDARNPRFVLTGLSPNQSYQFAVTAYNQSGKESGFSNTLIVTTAAQLSSTTSGSGTLGSTTLANYIITASAGTGGEISPMGTVSVPQGGTQKYVVTPSAGNVISDVVVNGASVGPVTSYTFTNVTKNCTIVAKFATKTYTVTASVQGLGTLSPAGAVTVTAGASKAFTITPSAGNMISDVVVNGASVGPVTSYTLANINKNCTIVAKFATGTTFQIEAGEVSVTHCWKRVNFTRKYTNPVVVAKSLSANGPDPAVVRIARVDNTGFEISVQEWDYLDGVHLSESIGYLVVEAGHHTLPNGTMVEAGYVESDQTEAFESIFFEKKFNVTPVVMVGVATFNAEDAVTVRVQNVNANGFDMMMQEEEASNQVHEMETIGYVAWEPYRGDIAGLTVEVACTGNVVTHNYKAITFKKAFGKVPSLVAGMQSFNGPNPADLRWTNKNAAGFQVKVEEEQSTDEEMEHAEENIGYIAVTALP
jgi:hypothetical protein